MEGCEVFLIVSEATQWTGKRLLEVLVKCIGMSERTFRPEASVLFLSNFDNVSCL